MIQLSDIITAVGLSKNSFPSAQVRLFDGKGREVTSSSVTYAKPIFADNPSAKTSFEAALREALEKCSHRNEPVCMQISADVVVLNYKTPQPRVFMRIPPLDPLDYMD